MGTCPCGLIATLEDTRGCVQAADLASLWSKIAQALSSRHDYPGMHRALAAASYFRGRRWDDD